MSKVVRWDGYGPGSGDQAVALAVATTMRCMPAIDPDGAGIEPNDDRRLVARIAAGDDLALARVYDRYGSLVFGLARRVTGSTSSAEEITQEVFVFLWEHPERFDGERGSLRAFLGAITHRRSVDVVRRETRRQSREDRVTHDPATATAAADPFESTDVAERIAR